MEKTLEQIQQFEVLAQELASKPEATNAFVRHVNDVVESINGANFTPSYCLPIFIPKFLTTQNIELLTGFVIMPGVVAEP